MTMQKTRVSTVNDRCRSVLSDRAQTWRRVFVHGPAIVRTMIFPGQFQKDSPTLRQRTQQASSATARRRDRFVRESMSRNHPKARKAEFRTRAAHPAPFEFG